jgi:hypothetical protein
MTLAQWLSHICDKSLDNAIATLIACLCAIIRSLHGVENSTRLSTRFTGPAKRIALFAGREIYRRGFRTASQIGSISANSGSMAPGMLHHRTIRVMVWFVVVAYALSYVYVRESIPRGSHNQAAGILNSQGRFSPSPLTWRRDDLKRGLGNHDGTRGNAEKGLWEYKMLTTKSYLPRNERI